MRPASGAQAEAFRAEDLSPRDHAAAEALLDLHLGRALPVRDDLALLVGPSAPSVRRIIRRAGRPVAHAALYTHAYRCGQEPLRIGVIGGVVTDPIARGQGLATLLLQDLLAEANKSSCDAVVLWSQVPGFYEKRGFTPGGRELLWSVSAGDLPVTTEVRPMLPQDAEQVFELHAHELGVSCRTRVEWETVLGIPRTAFYVLVHERRVRCYGAVGKGSDLEGCLHEWAGEEELLPALVAGVLSWHATPHLYVLGAPWKDVAAQAMAAHGIEAQPGILGMIHLPTPRALASRLGHPTSRSDQECTVQALFGTAETPGRVPFYLSGFDAF